MFSGAAIAIPANPEPFLEAQGDGTLVQLRAFGDEHFSWLEDADGYTVVRNKGWLHYAERAANGRLVAGPFRVGIDNPRALGLQKRVQPSAAARAAGTRSVLASQSVDMEAVATTGTLKNLVVMIRFSDHAGRALPPVSDYDILFNATGGHPSVAPTGSIRDAYHEMSYGQLTIDSTLTGWINVSNTEAYYANNQGGDSTLWLALVQALNTADASINFADFDQDNDGYIDSIAFLHSGYGAEWGGVLQRIWSHKWAIQNPSGGWQSNDLNGNGQRVRVFNYHISTGLWGTSGTNIGRIGVIAHETGHFLGLPDLYDTDSGAGDGIGSWGLMANSWGFDFEQYCPGHMSAWSKLQMGWVSPTVLSDPGTYVINQAETSPQAYRVNNEYPSGEYLLIENRQPTGLDCSMPQGGLAIFHIDDTAGYNTQGYPGQTGWPGNGNHYRVALLQADGQYHLEKGNNRGDSGDVHHAAGVDAIGPGPGGHPNTDAYKGGTIIQTGNTIFNISASGSSMSFCYNSCVGLAAPSSLAANATGSSSIALSWTDNSSDEGGFRLEHSTNGTSWSLEANLGANVTAYNDTGLAAGSLHYYRVRAFAGTDVSGWSNTASATTNQVPPTAPSGLSATGVSQSQIDLAWTDNSANETGFRVEVSTNGTNFTTLANRPAGTTTHSHIGLLANTTRHYRVYAVNAAGENVSNTASGTTLPPPPLVEYLAYAETHTSGTVSGNYTATHADDGSEQQITEQQSGGKPSNRVSSLEHAWRFNISAGDSASVNARARRSNNSEGDNIQFAWSTNGVNYTNLFVVNSATESSYQGSIPNTVSGEVYIRAIDTNRTPGNSATDSLWLDQLSIAVVNNGPPVAPNAPTGLGASAAGQASINLVWTDASNNEDGFHIERSPNGSSGWTQVDSVAANTTSWINIGLTASTTYWYRVRAFNGVGNSGYSNTASATTDAPTPVPNTPSNLVATATGANSIGLVWQDNSGNENGFRVERSANGSSGWAQVASLGANTTSWSNTGLAASTEYFYRVHAYNGTGNSGDSNVASATTDDEPPPPAIVLNVSSYKVKGSKAYDLSWSAAGGTSVDVYRDGVKVFTTANDGAHSYDSGEKGSGTHTHRVCELNSTTACSNIVSSTF